MKIYIDLPVLLDGVVGEELQAQAVALAGDDLEAGGGVTDQQKQDTH